MRRFIPVLLAAAAALGLSACGLINGPYPTEENPHRTDALGGQHFAVEMLAINEPRNESGIQKLLDQHYTTVEVQEYEVNVPKQDENLKKAKLVLAVCPAAPLKCSDAVPTYGQPFVILDLNAVPTDKSDSVQFAGTNWLIFPAKGHNEHYNVTCRANAFVPDLPNNASGLAGRTVDEFRELNARIEAEVAPLESTEGTSDGKYITATSGNQYHCYLDLARIAGLDGY